MRRDAGPARIVSCGDLTAFSANTCLIELVHWISPRTRCLAQPTAYFRHRFVVPAQIPVWLRLRTNTFSNHGYQHAPLVPGNIGPGFAFLLHPSG